MCLFDIFHINYFKYCIYHTYLWHSTLYIYINIRILKCAPCGFKSQPFSHIQSLCNWSTGWKCLRLHNKMTPCLLGHIWFSTFNSLITPNFMSHLDILLGVETCHDPDNLEMPFHTDSYMLPICSDVWPATLPFPFTHTVFLALFSAIAPSFIFNEKAQKLNRILPAENQTAERPSYNYAMTTTVIILYSKWKTMQWQISIKFRLCLKTVKIIWNVFHWLFYLSLIVSV